MAPSRRKGSSKAAAAAAAAACRQWKVGDLVLAKVKGFPAWPATVSEPEKWGYSTDWKKVLVYFFGTKQIAFCNPADVELFTEEKKETLLTKRQGKGADFVRAVQEIVDSYEKLKKQNRADVVNSADEVTVTNAGDSVESVGNLESKDQTETPIATLNLRLRTSCSAKDSSRSLPVEDAAATVQLNALPGREALSDELADNVLVSEAPLASTYSSRKRFRGTQPRSSVTLKRAPSLRRFRSSTKADFCRFNNFSMPSNDGSKSSGDITLIPMQDGSSRKNKASRKSPDVSLWHDVDSHAFVASGSIEDNGSEIVTADSDTHSLNEGSTIESGCKSEQPETIVECFVEDVRLPIELDLQANAVVTKKKRKPNRKRTTNDTAACFGRLDGEAGPEVGGQDSPSICERSNEQCSKEDGDEHLPLVKRARVRMSKPSAVEENLDNSEEREDKSPVEVTAGLTGLECTSLVCDDDNPVHRYAFVEKGDNSSPLNNDNQNTENRPLSWKNKNNQPYVCLAGGEAALPPSKRLHRALEAMSENAAEDGQVPTEAQSIIKMVDNGLGATSVRGCPDMAAEHKSGNALESQDTHDNNTSQVGTSGSSSCLIPPISEETSNSPIEVDICNKPVLIPKVSKHNFCKDMVMEAVSSIESTEFIVSSFGAHAVEPCQVQGPQSLSPNTSGRLHSFRSIEGSLHQLLPSNDEGKNCSYELNSRAGKLGKPVKEVDSLEHIGMSGHPVSEPEEVAEASPQNGGNSCENTKSLKPRLDDNIQIKNLCEVVKEVEHILTKKHIKCSLSPTSMNGVIAAGPGRPLQSYSAAISVHLSNKDVSSVPSSQPVANGLDSPAQVSHSDTAICHVSSDSVNSLKSNGYCSPTVYLRERRIVRAPDEGKLEPTAAQRSKFVGKCRNHAEANAALKSFEAMLVTLTRTKESIGRATRIAIDCAKFGIAAEVVEILACNLETDLRLHRRVDLFFLVDSITQCSRGLKGDIGGIYPTAIQEVLPRLLSAAAPPGNAALENRRQCMKVLRLWLERRILPESIIRHHMRELDSLNVSSSNGSFSRRPSRTERALNDPLREMEGMLVDEYGSNSSFQLPGFCMPRMLKDDVDGESDSDGGSFEAVTPEHNSETPEERETIPVSAVEKHRHILEDVDGELEMEDVAPNEVEMNSTSTVSGVCTAQPCHHQFDQHFPIPFAPPLPNDMPPSSPPLPTSPPPLPPPLLSSNSLVMSHALSMCTDANSFRNSQNMDSNLQQQSMTQQSVAPRINPPISDDVHYHAPEHRDFQMQQMSDSTSFSISHSPICPRNNAPQVDSTALHNKSYHLRPPHHVPSNQFSYVKVDQRMPPRREAQPPSYLHQYQFVPHTDGGNLYNDRDGMKSAPQEVGERWRYPEPTFPGPVNYDRDCVSYARGPYVGTSREPARIPNQGWAFRPQGMSRRNFVPIGPPSENVFPSAIRAPSFWRPR